MKNFYYAEKVAKLTIQSFGCIIICDSNGKIVSISSNFSDIFQVPAEASLNQSIYSFIERYFASVNTEVSTCMHAINTGQIQRQTIPYQKGDTRFGISIFQRHDKVYLEWEEQQNSSITYSQIDILEHLLENKSDIWEPLCTAIQDIIQFDRILLYHHSESGFGNTLVEKTLSDEFHFLGKQFSGNFMPKETIGYYRSSPFKYCPDLDAETADLLSLNHDVDLSVSQFSVLPDIHAQYLKFLGIKSLLVFPIVINGHFWGLLLGHNFSIRKVDFQKRLLCAFLVQSAANRYEAQLKEEFLSHQNLVKEIELNWKEKLIEHKNINCVLVQNIETLCNLPEADGVAIFHKGDIFCHGLCPTEKQILQIKQLVASLPKKPIFKDYNFRQAYRHVIEGELPFAGLMALQVANRDDFYIFWFRKENVNGIFHINLETEEKKAYKTWEETIFHSAIPWNENNLYFVSNLHKLIQDSIVLKSNEQERFNEQLVALNNELEMLTFTLSHDIKNPLAIIKLSLQMLQRNMQLEEKEKSKCLNMVASGIQDIESIIDGVLKLGKSKFYKFRKDPVPLAHLLCKITEEAKILYKSENCEFELGRMLPVWGEKSLIFQIFQNVIGNAVKYSATKQKPLIKINSYQLEDKIYYEIEDNGIGIPEESLSHIFNVFTRANNVQEFSGSGIGLCLVKRILERLGGEISINSQLNTGTKTTLIFPSLGEIHPSINIGKTEPDTLV